MKKRFLIVGDNHLDSFIRVRLDNYMESSLMELHESLRIAKAAKADYYILLGDVFNRITVGGECRNRAIDILSGDNGEPWPFEKYVVVGNHDIAYNPLYIGKSDLQTLISAEVVKCVDRLEELPVSFHHFTGDLDKQLKEGTVLPHMPDKIMFLHTSITDKPSLFDHILFKDLNLHPSTKIVCSGHIHAPMEATHKSGAKFFNPGSLGRTKEDESHDPQVLLLQYDFETDEYQHKYLRLKSSLSHDIIFDVDRNRQRRIEDKNTELFISTITDISLADTISGDAETDFKTFAKKRNANENVIKVVVDTIDIIKTGGTI